MSFSQSRSWTCAKAKDSRVSWSSSRKLLSERSFSPLNRQMIPHSLLLTHPHTHKSCSAFCPFYFSIWRDTAAKREHQLVQFLISEQVKAYWPMTASASSCSLSHSRAISSCSTFFHWEKWFQTQSRHLTPLQHCWRHLPSPKQQKF